MFCGWPVKTLLGFVVVCWWLWAAGQLWNTDLVL